MAKKYPVKRLNLMKEFHCLADKCWDNCCLGWAIDVDKDSLAKYKVEAPDLLEKIEERVGGGHKMKKNCKNCICLKNNLCTMQAKYGAEFLPNICYYFPNVYKKVGDEIYMGTNLACPASVELILYSTDKSDFNWYDTTVPRMRDNLYDCATLFQTKNPKRLMNIHKACMNIANDSTSNANQVFARLILFAQEYDKIRFKDKINFYGRAIQASSKSVIEDLMESLPEAKEDKVPLVAKILNEIAPNFKSDNNSYFKSINSIVKNVMNRDGEVVPALKKSELSELEEKILKTKDHLGDVVDEKLKKQIKEIEDKLEKTKKLNNQGGEKDYSSVLLEGTNIDNSQKNYAELKAIFDSKKSELEDVCKNYIRAKLCECLFPIGTSFSQSLKDVYFILIQYMLIRLAIICMIDKDGNLPDKQLTMKIFEAINKCFYAKKNNDLLEMTEKYIKADDVETMMSLLGDI